MVLILPKIRKLNHIIPNIESHLIITSLTHHLHEPRRRLDRLHTRWLVVCLRHHGCRKQLHPLANISHLLINHPTKIIQINHIETPQRRRPRNEAPKHDIGDLLLAILPFELLELIGGLGNAVAEEGLLVDHLLALFYLRQASELRENPLDADGGGPEVGVGIEGAEDNGAGVDPAESGEFGELLQKAFVSFLECGFSCGVVCDECQFYLLPRHAHKSENGDLISPFCVFFLLMDLFFCCYLY